ncbi:MAG: S-layer homology domain-containing protein [Syntrophomonadaceae bacterium]|nr:S-layer homology domain-containing protein [Syntrophomonadaceae bacterium]
MKRILLIFMLLMIPFIFTHDALAAEFKDTANHWAKGYINELSNRGYLLGYQDGTFQPDKVMTRAEFISVLLRCVNNSPAYNYSYTITGHWADSQINEAVRQGIIVLSEYPQGFNKDSAINRAEAAAMVVRALGRQPDYTYASFKDNETVNANPYAGYIRVAHQEGLITGYPDGEFKPYNYITRAQACVILSRYLTKANNNSYYYNYNQPYISDYITTSPATKRIATLSVDGYRYNPEYVNIYIDNKPSFYYLSDAEIVSANILRIGGVNYYLSDKNLSLKLQDDYYTINQVYWVNGMATLDVSKGRYRTDDYWYDISLSDIYAVYDRNGRSITRLDDIEFRVSGKSKIYDLDEIEIDLDDNYIIIDDKKYKPSKIDIRVKRTNYSNFDSWWRLVDVRERNDKIIFDCENYYYDDDDYIDYDDVVFIDEDDNRYYSDEVDIRINRTYRNFEAIDIIDRYEFEYGGDTYYFVDSTIRIDGTTYRIDYTRWRNNQLEIYIY